MVRVSHLSRFDVPPEALYRFHLDATNLVRISPPFPKVTVEEARIPTEEGDEQQIVFAVGPMRVRTTTRVVRLIPPESSKPGYIEDEMVAGPFHSWRHQHQVHLAERGAELRDVVAFRFFPTPLGGFADAVLVGPVLKLMFAWRHRRTRRLLETRRWR